MVLNSDILSGHDLTVQIDLHVKTDAAVTLHLVEVADPSRFGVVPTEETGRVTAFLEKTCLLYTSPSPRDTERSRMPSSA